MSDVWITKLEIRNFKRVVAGVWDLQPGLQRLTSGGKNKAGKTSVLHAIRTLFEGAGAVPPEPRHQDAEPETDALVRGWLSNGCTIKRTFTEKGSYLYVKTPDGMKGNQSTIDPWIGNGHFDPLVFFALSAEEQARALLELSSIEDLDERLQALDERGDEVYAERSPYISEQRHLRGVPKPEGNRPEPISVQSEMKELESLQQREHKWRQLEESRAKTQQQIAGRKLLIEDIEAEIAELRARLKNEREKQDQQTAMLEQIKEQLADRPDLSSQIEHVRTQIDRAEEVQEALEPWREYDRAQDRLQQVTAKVEELTDEIQAIQKEREDLIASAEFPIDGLGFEAGEVRLNGLPLEQASGRERIELGVLAAIAHDPTLRVILVDEGNDIDIEGLELLAETADEHGFQLIVARLGLEGPGELEVIDGWGPAPDDAPQHEGDDDG